MRRKIRVKRIKPRRVKRLRVRRFNEDDDDENPTGGGEYKETDKGK